ncbi:MAG: HK97 gp10 family phage protein [Oscillospiraceae bacterium]|jgi:hypothetical protein|nr:HK97 gp10 family phage protein [Oscillospiraceae bacterium]MBQ9837953.1 HK97 gp10 family phage protein [Oscillospiraceae bacterium]DAJ51462.1 MAG TPA: type I neck protein [Caudoviricetes sp.]
MAKMGGFSAADMKKLQKQLNKIQEGNVEAFIEACAKELAARLLAKVIKRTPVGEYPKSSGKKGGTLRRGWTSKTHEEAVGGSGKGSISAGKAYADTLTINHFGNTLVIEIVNPVEYASYVEYGHRTPDHKGWVQGRFMLTISEQEIQEIAPKVLEAKIKKFLGECMK